MFSFDNIPPPPSFSSYFSKKDNKFDISILILSFITFCALSTFCWIIFAINFTGWFFITVIGGTLSKFRQELFKSLSGDSKKEIMLDHRLKSPHRVNHFEDFRLSSSSKESCLPSIPSYRSSNKLNTNNTSSSTMTTITTTTTTSSNSSNNNSNNNNNNNNNNSSNKSNKFDSILSSFDFSFSGLTGNNNKSNKNKKKIPILAPSEYSKKRNEKRTKNLKQRHSPDIPSGLGPNRQEEWKSNVDYFPSERHTHQPKSKPSDTKKMIESTAAYRVGKKCNGWINGDSEEYAIRQKDLKPDCTSFTTYDDPFYSREPINELNVRLDQERPKITKQERRAYNKSPARSLQYARQYLTILLTVKKEMNL